MAGRGRGAGRGGMSFNIETLGFGRGEALPGPSLQPPPVFPTLELKPVPLLTGDEHDYILALKQEFRGTIRESPYFMKKADRKKDIVRYSDKYTLTNQDNPANWQPDWLRLPEELQRKVKMRSKVKPIIKPKIHLPVSMSKDKDKEKTIPEVEITKTLEELEKKEEAQGNEEDEENKEEEEEQIEEEEYYDEEDIDDTDYNQTYFDNGENYGLDEDDDLDEGPIY